MAKTLARYPIKSGPKQFSAYLTDMSSLLIEVLSGGMMVPVGYAEVTDLGKLSSSSPVKGYSKLSPLGYFQEHNDLSVNAFSKCALKDYRYIEVQ